MTHLVTISMNNHDGLKWDLNVLRYTDNTRSGVRGMPIGRIDADGFHTNDDDPDRIYMMEFASDGRVMFFEKNRHIADLKASCARDQARQDAVKIDIDMLETALANSGFRDDEDPKYKAAGWFSNAPNKINVHLLMQVFKSYDAIRLRKKMR